MKPLRPISVDSAIRMTWNKRNKSESEHDTMVRISNAFNVSVAHVYQLIKG